jgi:hypothetical protein
MGGGDDHLALHVQARVSERGLVREVLLIVLVACVPAVGAYRRQRVGVIVCQTATAAVLSFIGVELHSLVFASLGLP